MILRLFSHWAVLFLGLYLVTLIRPLGITFDSMRDLIWASLILILLNTLIRPILILISLPLVLLTLGLFLLIINAVILDLLPHFVRGFHVPGFRSAFFGSLLLSLVTGFFSRSEKRVSVRRVNSARTINQNPSSGKVIDI